MADEEVWEREDGRGVGINWEGGLTEAGPVKVLPGWSRGVPEALGFCSRSNMGLNCCPKGL